MTPSPDARLARKARILVVEDDEVLCTIYRGAFDFDDLDVAFSADGVDALQKVEAFHPDLIVLDIDIPSISGWELLTELRRDAESIPVVVASALADPVQAEQMGASACFVKPFRLSLLRDACLEILNRSSDARAMTRVRAHSFHEPLAAELAIG